MLFLDPKCFFRSKMFFEPKVFLDQTFFVSPEEMVHGHMYLGKFYPELILIIVQLVTNIFQFHNIISICLLELWAIEEIPWLVYLGNKGFAEDLLALSRDPIKLAQGNLRRFITFSKLEKMAPTSKQWQKKLRGPNFHVS